MTVWTDFHRVKMISDFVLGDLSIWNDETLRKSLVMGDEIIKDISSRQVQIQQELDRRNQ